MSASSAASILSCIFCKLLRYAFSIRAFSFCAWLQSCERIDLKGALVLEENKDSQHWWRGESWWYWWFAVSPSVWLKRCLGTICIQNYFHLTHLHKFSHWTYTCLVKKQSAPHQKLVIMKRCERRKEKSLGPGRSDILSNVLWFFGKAWSAVLREKFWMMRRCVLEYVFCWHEQTWLH